MKYAELHEAFKVPVSEIKRWPADLIDTQLTILRTINSLQAEERKRKMR